jgi:hypothetical protein
MYVFTHAFCLGVPIVMRADTLWKLFFLIHMPPDYYLAASLKDMAWKAI